MSALPILVLAAASILDATGHLSPEAFEFVMPAVTRKEVDKRLGKPWVSSIGVVVKGEIDLFVDSVFLEPGPRAPRETEGVHYYEYRPDDHPSQFARIVFRGKEVWYAQLPPRIGERTRAEIESRHGPGFEVSTLRAGTRHLPESYNLHRLPKKGLAFLESRWGIGKRPGEITHRIVFPPEAK